MKQNKLFILPILLTSTLIGCKGNNPDADVLTSIEVALVRSETVFMEEESFTRPVVIANYSKSGQKNVSSEAIVKGQDLTKVGEQEVTVSYEGKTTTYKIVVCDNKYDYFSHSLMKYQGHTNSKSFKVVRSNGYLTTGSDFLTVDLEDVGTTRRYKKDDSYLVTTTGVAAYLNEDGTTSDSCKYETQIYNDSDNYYKITNYSKFDWENQYQKIPYSKDNEEANFNIGFAYDDVINVQQMKEMEGNVNFGLETTNFERNIVDGVWHFGYKVITYQIEAAGQRTIHSSVSYDTKLTIEYGEGTHLDQTYTYEEYYGGVKCAYVTAISNVDYKSGEYDEFKGSVLPYVEVE